MNLFVINIGTNCLVIQSTFFFFFLFYVATTFLREGAFKFRGIREVFLKAVIQRQIGGGEILLDGDAREKEREDIVHHSSIEK